MSILCVETKQLLFVLECGVLGTERPVGDPRKSRQARSSLAASWCQLPIGCECAQRQLKPIARLATDRRTFLHSSTHSRIHYRIQKMSYYATIDGSLWLAYNVLPQWAPMTSYGHNGPLCTSRTCVCNVTEPAMSTDNTTFLLSFARKSFFFHHSSRKNRSMLIFTIFIVVLNHFCLCLYFSLLSLYFNI